MFYACGRFLRNTCGLSRYHNTRPSQHIHYDDIFFRLYYRFTCTILLLVSVIIVLREWSVDSIDCNIPAAVITEVAGVGGELSYYRLNAYCKMHNRFIPLNTGNIESSLKCLENGSRLFTSVPKFTPTEEHVQTIPKYQWFSLILFIAALFVYLPHLLWKCSNRSMIKSVVVGRFRRRRSSHRFSLDQLIKISIQSSEIGGHQCLFATFYLVLKALNLAILLALVFLTNILLSSHFLLYPVYFFDKLQTLQRPILVDQQSNQLSQSVVNCSTRTLYSSSTPNPTPYFEDIFPKSSLCPYTYLDSKTSQSNTVLVNCLMPINSLLEQIFLFLWFWYALLLLFTALDFTRYLLLFCCGRLRAMLLKYNTNNILLDATYRKCAESFSSWLFTTIVLINNQGNGTFQHYHTPVNVHHHNNNQNSGQNHFQASPQRNLEVIEEEPDDDITEALYETIEMQTMRNTSRNNGTNSNKCTTSNTANNTTYVSHSELLTGRHKSSV